MNAEIQSLLAKANSLPHGSAKFDLNKEAVRLADVSNDLEAQFTARLALVEAATFSNRPAESVVGFTWLLNHLAAFGDGRDRSVLWSYKWVLDTVIEFPEFNRAQIDYFFQDSRKRFSDYLGNNTLPIDAIEIGYLIQCGRFNEATQLIDRIKHTPRCTLSDCEACDDSRMALYWFTIGNAEAAVKDHEAMLASRRTCAEEPVRSNSRAALYYAALGRWQEAAQSYSSAAARMWRNESLIQKCSRFGMAYKFLGGQDDDALAIFDAGLIAYVKCAEKNSVFEFYLIAHRLMEKLQAAGHEELALKSAALLPLRQDGERRLRTKELSDWLLVEAAEIGRAFDKRNDATAYARLIDQRWPFLVGQPA